MGTEKRERQKANREERLRLAAAEAKKAARIAAIKRGLRIGVLFLILSLAVWLIFYNDSNENALAPLLLGFG